MEGPKALRGPDELRKAAERRWDEALALRDQAQAAYARASQFLDQALNRDGAREETRRLIAEMTYERVLLAERFHQQRERDEWAQLLLRGEGTGTPKEVAGADVVRIASGLAANPTAVKSRTEPVELA